MTWRTQFIIYFISTCLSIIIYPFIREFIRYSNKINILESMVALSLFIVIIWIIAKLLKYIRRSINNYKFNKFLEKHNE